MEGRNQGSFLIFFPLGLLAGNLRKIYYYLMICFYFCFQFQRTFESFKNVSNKSDLQKAYQKLGKELENLDYLAFKRQQVGVSTLLGGRDEHFRLPAVLPIRGAGGSAETYLLMVRAEIACSELICCVHKASCSVQCGLCF